MIHLLSTVLQFIYLASWIVGGVLGLRYQVRVYAWMLRNRIAIDFGLTLASLRWCFAMTVLAVGMMTIMYWIHWTDAVFWVGVTAPFIIIMMTLMYINEAYFRIYDCLDAYTSPFSRSGSA